MNSIISVFTVAIAEPTGTIISLGAHGGANQQSTSVITNPNPSTSDPSPFTSVVLYHTCYLPHTDPVLLEMTVQYLEGKVDDMAAVQKNILLRLENIEKLIRGQEFQKRAGHTHPAEQSWQPEEQSWQPDNDDFDDSEYWRRTIHPLQLTHSSPLHLQTLSLSIVHNLSTPSHSMPLPLRTLNLSLPPLSLALNHTLHCPSR